MNPIVGIGEVLWDVFPDGRKVAGGAPFNFAFHCHQLGHPAAVVSRVGDDDLGRELRDEVRRLGLSDEYIQTDPEHPTGTVRVSVDAAGQPSYTITENVAWDYIAWDERLARRMFDAPAICFGTLVQRHFTSRGTLERLHSNVYGLVGLENPFELFPWAERVEDEEDEEDEEDDLPPRRVVVFDMNFRQHFYSREVILGGLRGSTWCKVSDEELAVLAGMFDLDWSSDSVALDSLGGLNNWGKDTLCLTRGGNGCLVRRGRWIPVGKRGEQVRKEEECDEPGVPAKVVDTVGAGDSFTAAMVCLHLEGRPLRECVRFANHYAARVCEYRGATPRIDRAEVERAAFGAG